MDPHISARLFIFGEVPCLFTILLLCPGAHGQVDQGTITGSVEDSTGAVVLDAQLTLTTTDTDLVLQRAANSTGTFVFSPLKIGNYKLSATASGFQTTTQEKLHLDIQQRLNLVLKLEPCAVSETIQVSSAPSLLQTQQSTEDR
jgi:Carboxypeptidase regulatory-like domain